jgi:hypothetical protein
MKVKIIGILIFTLLIASMLPVMGWHNDLILNENESLPELRDYGDAPEGDGAIAYPSSGTTGKFPTCVTVGPLLWVQHNNFGAWFGQGVDFEADGNGGICPQCFPPYDQDEGYMDGDAGLIMPEPFTIDNTITVVPFPGFVGTPLGKIGQIAVWGNDIDIHVHNTMPSQWEGYFNLLIDYNQNGQWGDPGEHVIVNFWPIPNPYDGPISGLMPPNFVIGMNPGYVWARFTISEKPVPMNWKGEEDFEDGESEDYLLLIDDDAPPPKADLECRGSLTWTNVKPGTTVSNTFEIRNNGDPGSLLNWHVSGVPAYGTWSFSPSSGTNLAPSSWVTVTATCVAPNQGQQTFTGDITVENSDNPTDSCIISTSLTTPRIKNVNRPIFNLIPRLIEIFPLLKTILLQF